MEQGFLSLNIENLITIALMVIGLYLIFSLVAGLFGSPGGDGPRPGFSWSTNLNLAT